MRRASRALMYTGVAGLVVLFGVLHAWEHGYDPTGTSRLPWTVAYVAVLLTALYGLGLPDLRGQAREAWQGAVTAVGVGAGAISIVQLVVGDALLPRYVVFGSALAVVPWAVMCARATADGLQRTGDRDRVLLVASDADRVGLLDELDRSPERPAQLVATLDPEVAACAGGAPLLDLARSCRASVVVLSREAQVEERVVAQVALLHETGTRVRTLSMFYEEWLGKLPVSELERVSLLFDIGEVHRLRYGRLKRIADVVIGLAGLLVLAVVIPVVLVGNVVANRGPLLFRQERVGKGGARFAILKFRTMVDRGPALGRAEWTSEDDPRITPFGRFLRRSHLDELPQVVNMLRGDLSIVGPRPEQPGYVDELVTKLPFYGLRHLVRPGLTGWAQVKYGYASDHRDALEKLQYEFFYLRHQRLGLDARILGRSVRSVLGGPGSGR